MTSPPIPLHTPAARVPRYAARPPTISRLPPSPRTLSNLPRPTKTAQRGTTLPIYSVGNRITFRARSRKPAVPATRSRLPALLRICFRRPPPLQSTFALRRRQRILTAWCTTIPLVPATSRTISTSLPRPLCHGCFQVRTLPVEHACTACYSVAVWWIKQELLYNGLEPSFCA